MCATRAPTDVMALPRSRGEPLERFRSAVAEARELMRRAERAARRRQWREAAQQLKQSQAELDRAQYELIREMRAENLSWPAIGRELGERNWEAVYQRFQRLERRFGQPPPADQPPETDG
jgi:alkylation response protein AidB-like acyl-CoA dehydrogenase